MLTIATTVFDGVAENRLFFSTLSGYLRLIASGCNQKVAESEGFESTKGENDATECPPMPLKSKS